MSKHYLVIGGNSSIGKEVIKKFSKDGDHCYYDPNQKTGENACPLNSLYWHFYHRNEVKLKNNPRIGMMYNTWHQMDKEQQSALLNQAEYYLSNIDKL